MNNIIKRKWNQNSMVIIEDLQGMAFQAESGGHTFQISGVDGEGNAVALSGTPAGVLLRADGQDVTLTCSVSGGVVFATLPANAYVVPGRFGLTIFLTSDGQKTAIYAAVGTVGKTSSGTVAPPAGSDVVDLVNAIAAAVATIPASYSALLADIAPTYSNSALYSVGQYAWYDGDLKRCIVPITTAESYTAAHWTSAVLGQDVSDLKSAFQNVTGISTLDSWVDGYAYRTQDGDTITPGSPISNSSVTCSYMSCGEDDVFTLYFENNFNAKYRPWCFIDSNGTQLKKAEDNNDQSGTEITAPENAAYLVVNARKTAQHIVYKGRNVIPQIEEKQDVLTFDEYPASGSSNPVKSNGINYEIEEIRTAIGTYNKTLTVDSEQGYYWNSETDTAVKTSGVSTYRAYDAVPVNPGERYKIYGYDNTSSKQYMVLVTDSEYKILAHYGERSGSYKTYNVLVPENAAYILMTTGKNYSVTISKVILTNNNTGTFIFDGKNIAIIGDSISTNGNWSENNPYGNIPEIIIQDEDVGVELSAYATYYDIGTTIGGHEIVSTDVGTEITFTPVAGDVGKIVGKPKNNNAESVVTWWEVAQKELGFNSIPVCWSGSSITSHEGTADEYKTSYAWHPAQIRKCGIRTPGTMTRTAPDMIIIYRGTNDFSHYPYSKLTENYFSYPWTYPVTDEISGGFGYKEGLCLTIRKLREAYPSAQIVLCTCNFFKRIHYSSYPVNNGEYTENQLNDAIREVANWMGCKMIEFDKDGLTFENASSTYYQDSTAFTHPTTEGHKILGNRALLDMKNINKMT